MASAPLASSREVTTTLAPVQLQGGVEPDPAVRPGRHCRPSCLDGISAVVHFFIEYLLGPVQCLAGHTQAGTAQARLSRRLSWGGSGSGASAAGACSRSRGAHVT